MGQAGLWNGKCHPGMTALNQTLQMLGEPGQVSSLPISIMMVRWRSSLHIAEAGYLYTTRKAISNLAGLNIRPAMSCVDYWSVTWTVTSYMEVIVTGAVYEPGKYLGV